MLSVFPLPCYYSGSLLMRLLHLFSDMQFTSPSPPHCISYFSTSPFLNVVALLTHSPLPIKLTDLLVFPLHSRKEEEPPTMQQLSSFALVPALPCILIYIKVGYFKGHIASGEAFAAEGGETEVDY